MKRNHGFKALLLVWGLIFLTACGTTQTKELEEKDAKIAELETEISKMKGEKSVLDDKIRTLEEHIDAQKGPHVGRIVSEITDVEFQREPDYLYIIKSSNAEVVRLIKSKEKIEYEDVPYLFTLDDVGYLTKYERFGE